MILTSLNSKAEEDDDEDDKDDDDDDDDDAVEDVPKAVSDVVYRPGN